MNAVQPSGQVSHLATLLFKRTKCRPMGWSQLGEVFAGMGADFRFGMGEPATELREALVGLYRAKSGSEDLSAGVVLHGSLRLCSGD